MLYALLNIFDISNQGGVQKCVSVLERCLDTQDWPMACLVCQALWNYCIDSPNITDSIEDEESLCNLEGNNSLNLEIYTYIHNIVFIAINCHTCPHICIFHI